MADVATKNKSIVSNNTVNSLGKTKISDAVCGVQSNNGLIELDHNGHTTTTNATNNKLTLRSTSPTNDDDNEDDDEEDDDLILANNTRNELDSQDDSKSLQELIESELALRICANSNDSDATEDDETSEMSLNHQPEITKKIILEPRREEPVLDVNADFIVNEIDHYTLIREPYPYSNGHITPETNGTSHKVNGDQLIDDDEEAGDLHTETTETEVTTTTSGPSLPSAYEATPDVVPQVVENGHQEQVEEVPSVNTLSDSCVDTTEEDTSKALSNKSVISAEDKDDTENLSEDQLNKSEDEEDSVKIYDNVDEQSYQKSSDYAAALSNNSFIENKGHNGLEVLQEEPSLSLKEASGIDEKACSFYATDGSNGLTNNDDRPTPDITDYKLKEEPEENGWITVAEVNQKSRNDDSLQEKTSSEMFYSQESSENYLDKSRLDDAEKSERSLAPIATPDEISDISNANDDSESREEVITTSSVVSTTTKKKKKIAEGSPGSDASPNHTKTKKTKKSKKSELEKENISVKKKIKSKETKESMHTGPRQSSGEMIEISAEDDLSNVNVKSLTQTYVTETSRVETEKSNKEIIATGVSIKQLCRSFGDVSNMNEGDRQSLNSTDNNRFQERAKSTGDLRLFEQDQRSKYFNRDNNVFAGVNVKALKSSFNKFDALSKKSSQVLHVRSVDASKVQQQLNSIPNGDANPNCRSCGKVVFQMEQTKAEGMVWHKNCFRCVQCSKQLMVDNYESHEATLYCKPHFKELFQPKPVEESDQPMRPRKPEMIIRENQPKELPPDVVRASDKPDLGLEELSSLNVKSRFQVFEKSNENVNEIERSPSQVAVKRSPSILSKLAKFQAKGMDIGVTDESLNGIPFEESSESEEEIEEEETEEVESETTIVKAKRGCRERPISFSKMDDIKNRWESTSQQGRRESQREARKEEMAGIRSRLFMGKQGKMKEMYQQAVADSEKITKVNAAEEIQHTTNARSIKERFERGEPIAPTSDDEQQQEKQNKGDKPDEEILAAGISRKSRSLFLEMDATAAKTGRPVTPNSQAKTPVESPRRARDAFMGRQVSEDVVRSTDTTEEIQVDNSEISNKFKFFESYREPEKTRKQFRITPPRDGQVKVRRVLSPINCKKKFVY